MAINLCTICLGIDRNVTKELGQLISINCHFHDFCNWKIFNKNLFPKTATTVSLKMSAESFDLDGFSGLAIANGVKCSVILEY